MWNSERNLAASEKWNENKIIISATKGRKVRLGQGQKRKNETWGNIERAEEGGKEKTKNDLK